MDADRVIALLQADPAERLIRTHGEGWRLCRSLSVVEPEIVASLIQGGTRSKSFPGRLIPNDDSLFGHLPDAQTWVWHPH